MRSTWWLVGILLVGVIVYGLFFFQEEGSTFSGEADFAIADTSIVDRVVLTRIVQGESKAQVDLRKGADGNWQLNQTYPAFKPRVKQMLGAMNLMQVRERLVGQGQRTAQEIIKTQHVRLDAYHEGDQIRSYLIGTQTSDAKGTVMRMRSGGEAFVMEIPGFQGYLNGYFPLSTEVWRENKIAPIEQRLLQSYVVLYADQEQEGLEFIRQGDRLAPTFEGADSSKVAQFLAEFKGVLYAETFATEDYPGQLEALREKNPDVTVQFTYPSGDPIILYLYERLENPNNYFAWIEGQEELLTVQHFVIDKFLKHPRDFQVAQGSQPTL